MTRNFVCGLQEFFNLKTVVKYSLFTLKPCGYFITNIEVAGSWFGPTGLLVYV